MIGQAVANGATSQILYERRKAKTKVISDSRYKLFDTYFADRRAGDKTALKKRYGPGQVVPEVPQHTRWVCIDLLRHCRKHIHPKGFTGN
ncbi:MAG: type I restriction enzyme R subunit [Bradyrhizobium sp.]|jgi:type I restriction enzyme R subunit